MESYLEARLWNDVFVFSQDCGRAAGRVRATVLIETILGAFQMDEILYELRDIPRPELAAGIHLQLHQKFRQRADFLVPDRAQVTMDRHFLNSVQLLIKTCHRRGIHAMAEWRRKSPSRTTRRRMKG
jgi:malate synthase